MTTRKIITPQERMEVSAEYERLVKTLRPQFGNDTHISLAKRIDEVSREVRALKGKPQTGMKLHEMKQNIIRTINHLNKK